MWMWSCAQVYVKEGYVAHEIIMKHNFFHLIHLLGAQLGLVRAWCDLQFTALTRW